MENKLRPQPGPEGATGAAAAEVARISALLPNRRCFALVRPALEEEDLQQLHTVELSQLREKFQAGFAAFTGHLFSVVRPLCISETPLIGPMLVALLQALVGSMNGGAVPNVASACHNMVQAQNTQAATAAFAAYEHYLDRWLKAKRRSVEDLQVQHLVLLQEAYAMYQLQAIGGEDERQAFKDRLLRECHHSFMFLKQSMLAAAAEQKRRQAVTQLEQQQTRMAFAESESRLEAKRAAAAEREKARTAAAPAEQQRRAACLEEEKRRQQERADVAEGERQCMTADAASQLARVHELAEAAHKAQEQAAAAAAAERKATAKLAQQKVQLEELLKLAKAANEQAAVAAIAQCRAGAVMVKSRYDGLFKTIFKLPFKAVGSTMALGGGVVLSPFTQGRSWPTGHLLAHAIWMEDKASFSSQGTGAMAKSKNHTAHNQTRKAHRNGIKKPQRQRYTSRKGMDPKFLRNQRYAQKHNKPAEQK
ncbi:hypothetical protein ABPG75_000057 [Micractinium tetrahymenae]